MLCINFNDQELNLIIENEKDMEITIAYLLEMLHYKKIFTKINLAKQCILKAKESGKKKLQNQIKKYQDKHRSRACKLDFNNVVKYYRFLRIKMKISYSAWRRRVTVTQLFYQQIFNSYVVLKNPKNL